MLESVIVIALGVTLAAFLIAYRVEMLRAIWAVFKVLFTITVFGALGAMTQFM